MLVRAIGLHSNVHWEELMAGECADAILEHTLAQKKCEVTEAAGRKVGADTSDPVIPPGFQATLFVTPVARDEKLMDARVVVTWTRDLSSGAYAEARLERSLRRRAKR